jgi:hypothetical protein
MMRVTRICLLAGFSLAAACGGNEKGDEGKSTTAAEPAEPADEAAGAKKDLPEAAKLMEGHLEAIGGREAITKFETLYFESSVDTGAQNIKASAKTWWKQGKFYGEQEIPGFGTAKSGYDGTVVWVDDPINGLRKLEGKEAEQIIREGAIFLVADWQAHFESAETVDSRDEDGSTLLDVKLTSKLGDEVVMSFDQQSKLLTGMQFKQITPTGSVPVTAFFEDYKEVEGVKFAQVSKLKIALGTVTQKYDSIQMNVEVDENKFRFPGSEGAVKADPSAAGAGSAEAGDVAPAKGAKPAK